MTISMPVEPDVVNADAELRRVLDIARQIGAASNDQVDISYTSLFIGIMWSDGPTSRWLDAELDALGARRSAVYAQRRMDENQRASILARADAGETSARERDPISVSARTVLSEARSLATETGVPVTGPLSTRHVAAVYFFRNPPAHNSQFHTEWGFEKEVWRREFAEFIATTYPNEEPSWSQVLSGYVSTADPVSHQVPGKVLGDYRFELESVGVLRALEAAVGGKAPPLMSSGGLLEVLVSARALPDCAAFADLAADRLGIKGTLSLPTPALSFEGSGSSYATSRGFKNVLDRARSLSRSTTGMDTIGVRHLIASILVDPDSTANQRLVRSGVSLPLVREKLLKVFGRRWLNDDGPQWQLIMVGSTLPTIAEIHPDVADRGEDRLDVGRYARAFATVIAAERVNPPFSVGVFGDWGSGKSFFMRLMSDQTQQLSAFADTDREGRRLFCQRIVSIRFNAWHYAEGELLASLVQTILEGLRDAIVGDQSGSGLMDAIVAKLEIAKVARDEAEERLRVATQERENSRVALEDAREEARKRAEAIQTVESRDVVAAVRDVILPPVKMDEALTVAERFLGLEGLTELKRSGTKTASQVMAVVQDARVVTARARSTWDWLLRAPVDWRESWLLLAGVVLVLAAFVAVAIRLHESWPGFYGLVINIVGIAALAAKWAERRLRTVSSGLDQLDEIRRQVDGALAAKRSEAEAEIEETQRRHEAAEQRVEQAETRLREAEAARAKAEQEMIDSRTISRMVRLLDERLTQQSYQRHLGIVAAVRSDFQRLSDFMKSLRDDRGPNPRNLRPIDRIVLYIDDLDRCPSSQVVAVLEAIHLLLAFELFVVVVGVDIRWAAKSLVEKYPRHLTAGVYEGGQMAEGDGVSALDYLEKIFQIPFWLPPMEEDASRNMIAEMVPRIVEAGAAAVVASAESSAGPSVRDAGPADDGAAADTRSTKEPATNAQSLVIEPEERNFMLQLAGAVGKSPRRLKRFVNTYRILKASLDNLQQETFVVKGGREGEYRAAMTLLAMVTAAPRSSLGMLNFLASAEEAAELSVFEAHIAGSKDASEIQYVQAAVQAYRNSDPGATLRALRRWAPQVARFSFRSGRA